MPRVLKTKPSTVWCPMRLETQVCMTHLPVFILQETISQYNDQLFGSQTCSTEETRDFFGTFAAKMASHLKKSGLQATIVFSNVTFLIFLQARRHLITIPQ